MSKYNIIHLKEIDSTNTEAKRQIEHGLAGNSVILADMQTSGRARDGRDWVSPPGNLYFSVVLKFPKLTEELTQLSFVAATSLHEVLREWCENLSIKWPNDILLNKKKICGILLESMQNNNKVFVIIGIGINLTSSPNLSVYPTTYLLENGAIHSPQSILQSFLRVFDKYLQIWSNNGFGQIRSEWLKYAQNLGKMITCRIKDKETQGIFETIDEHGNLILKMQDDSIIKIGSGEVWLN